MNIVGFGDFLIHFSPTEDQRFDQADLMRVSFTGAEANVCAALSLWGENVEFVTKVPDHALARRGLRFLGGLGVHTGHVPTGGSRMGIYFLENGRSIRPSAVIYDRQSTAFSTCVYEDYDWDRILEGKDAFYLSGITPSLSEELLCCCEKVLAKVRERDIPVFFDLNLRPAICDIFRSREVFDRLKQHITHLIGNEEHLKQLLEIVPAPTEAPSRLKDFAGAVREKTGIGHVAVTVRRTPNAGKAITYAAYDDGTDFAVSSRYELDVIDRVGSGDAFSAGLVYSVMHGSSAEDSVGFAAASCALKHTISNDISYCTVEEVRSVMRGSARDVRR